MGGGEVTMQGIKFSPTPDKLYEGAESAQVHLAILVQAAFWGAQEPSTDPKCTPGCGHRIEESVFSYFGHRDFSLALHNSREPIFILQLLHIPYSTRPSLETRFPKSAPKCKAWEPQTYPSGIGISLPELKVQ